MCQTPSTPASVAPAVFRGAGVNPAPLSFRVRFAAAWPRPVLDAERLDVFHVSVELYGLVPQLLERADRNLRDPLERASSSVTLNICEGAARRAPREKAHFFAIARGSAAESAAIVHLLLSRGRVSILEAKRARALVVRIVAMLTRLEQRFRQCP